MFGPQTKVSRRQEGGNDVSCLLMAAGICTRHGCAASIDPGARLYFARLTPEPNRQRSPIRVDTRLPIPPRHQQKQNPFSGAILRKAPPRTGLVVQDGLGPVIYNFLRLGDAFSWRWRSISRPVRIRVARSAVCAWTGVNDAPTSEDSVRTCYSMCSSSAGPGRKPEAGQCCFRRRADRHSPGTFSNLDMLFVAHVERTITAITLMQIDAACGSRFDPRFERSVIIGIRAAQFPLCSP